MLQSPMGVTLKDIARDLGVSVITVSKALRNHSDISDQTKARVLKRVQEVNYRPNLAARALVTGRTNMIGFVIPDLLNAVTFIPLFQNEGRSVGADGGVRGIGDDAGDATHIARL